ncbi:hypothetical protein ACJX0J_024491, partial [Zea mays]
LGAVRIWYFDFDIYLFTTLILILFSCTLHFMFILHIILLEYTHVAEKRKSILKNVHDVEN